MEDKYIDLLLKRCLNFDKSKSLFVNYDKVNKDFVEKLIDKARGMGIEDIYLDEKDIYKTHDILKKINIEDIENEEYFNEHIWDVYAKKDANFLILDAEFPGVMDDIDSGKLAKCAYVKRTTKPLYKKKQNLQEIPWCIAALPNEVWASSLFKDEPNSLEKLSSLIYSMCMVDTSDPIKSWDSLLDETKMLCDKLNNLHIKSLHYRNSLGTDLEVGYPEDLIWCSAATEDSSVICNMPSYEIFTSPDYRKTNGVVYSSKPLVYNGVVIDEFYIEFKDGKVVNFGAKKGYDVLKEIIDSDSNSCYLGETALVNNDSPISNTGLVFGTTLFDENASCHLALGSGFSECIKNGFNMSDEELLRKGVNKSNTHVDFMIGTSDMNITATTDKEEILIFKDGNFNI